MILLGLVIPPPFSMTGRFAKLFLYIPLQSNNNGGICQAGGDADIL